MPKTVTAMRLKPGKQRSSEYVALCNRKIENARKHGNAHGVEFWTDQRNCRIEFDKRKQKQ
jgi:hypothetical protein